jgi:hypothetical protein
MKPLSLASRGLLERLEPVGVQGPPPSSARVAEPVSGLLAASTRLRRQYARRRRGTQGGVPRRRRSFRELIGRA